MKAMVGVVLAILIIFCIRLFWPSSDMEISNDIQSNNIQEEIAEETIVEKMDSTPGTTLPELNNTEDKAKTRLMRAEYETLEDARIKLKKHIGKLKHDMWGLTFPKETAKKVSNAVLGASRLLKNPNMLGAFHNVEQIKDEIAKVNFAQKSLQEVDEIIKAKIEEGADAEEG